MENQENQDGEKKCCGLRCGCGVCKSMKAVVLLLLGGGMGFFFGRCGTKMCPISGGPAPTVNASPNK